MAEKIIVTLEVDAKAGNNAVSALEKAITEASKGANTLADAEQRVFDIQKKQITQNAKLNAELQKNLKAANDTTLSIDKRLKAQSQVNEITEKLIKNETELAAAQIAKLQTELKTTENLKERNKLQLEIQRINANLFKSEQSLSAQREQSSDAFKNDLFDINSQLDKLSGGAISGFKNIVSGVKSGVKSMGALKVAIASTGIGLLVIAAAALIEYFSNFEKPLRIVDTVMNAIGGAINAIVENFGKLLAGDFIGFFESVGDAAMDAVDATNALYDAQERIFDVQKRTIVQNAELRAQLEEGQKIAGDTTLSLEERLRGQEAVNRSSEQLIKNERELVQAQLQRLQSELALANNYKERRDLEIQIEETTANLINVEAELNRQRLDAAKAEREIIAQDQATKDAATKEEMERIKALQEERTAAILAIEDALRTANEREIFETRQKYNNLIEQARKFGQDTVELERARREALAALDPQGIDPLQQAFDKAQAELQIEKEAALQALQNRIEIDQQISDRERQGAEIRMMLAQQERDAKLAIFTSLANSIGGLIGEQTAAGKAAALASAIISTYQGINAALAQTTDITPTQTLRFANAAAVGIAGLASVKNILQTRVPGGGGGGGGSAPSIRPPQAPQVGSSMGLINPNEQGGQIGDSLAQGLSQRPVRAYVTAGDVISGTDLENRIRANGQFE